MFIPVAAGNIIYDMAGKVFGSDMAESLNDWMSLVIDAMKTILGNAWVTDVTKVFTIVGCSFMIIYFFADLMNQASKDMFTFDKMVIAFIRMIIAFAILLFLPDILKGLPAWTEEFKNVVFVKGTDESLYGSIDGISDIWGSTDGLDKYNSFYNHFTKLLHIIGAMFGLFIPYLIAVFAELMGKFIITSTAVMLIVRALFAPLAVVQIFEDGTRSSGIRYLKGLLAEGLSFACILAIILVSSSITGELVGKALGGITVDLRVTPESLNDALRFDTLVIMIIPKLVVAGGMASGSKIAHDVMGA